MVVISIHVSAEGTTILNGESSIIGIISIHVPREGDDPACGMCTR